MGFQPLIFYGESIFPQKFLVCPFSGFPWGMVCKVTCKKCFYGNCQLCTLVDWSTFHMGVSIMFTN
jgi:hypothetical protein